jgi:hypothetical protein
MVNKKGAVKLSLPWRSRSQHDLGAKSYPAHNFDIWSRILQLFHRNDHHIETMCCAQHFGCFYTFNVVCDITLTLQEVYLPVSKTKPVRGASPGSTGSCFTNVSYSQGTYHRWIFKFVVSGFIVKSCIYIFLIKLNIFKLHHKSLQWLDNNFYINNNYITVYLHFLTIFLSITEWLGENVLKYCYSDKNFSRGNLCLINTFLINS